MYSFDSRIRFSETGVNGCLHFSGLLDYYQDCVTFHAHKVGLPHKVLAEKELAWVVMRWQAEMKKRPEIGKQVTVRTTPYRFGGFAGLRAFSMTGEDGEILSRADSMWAMINTRTGRPTRVTEEVSAPYGVGSAEPMDWKAPALEKGAEYEEYEQTPVRREMLDVNGHVNNVWYLRLAEAMVKNSGEYTRLCIEYKRSAMPGDTLYIGIHSKENGVQADFCDRAGQPYAMVWFGKEE